MPALFGLAHVLLLFLGSAAVAGTSGPGRHSLHAPPADVAAYVAAADPARVWTGEYLAVLAYLLFIPFAAYLSTVLRAAPEWIRTSLRGAAWLYAGLGIAGIAALLPPLHRELEPVQAAAFLDLRTALLGLSLVLLAAWLVAAGAGAMLARALPRWLTWTAAGIGLLQLAAAPLAAYADEITGLPTFAAFLWIVAVSVLLARRAHPARPR